MTTLKTLSDRHQAVMPYLIVDGADQFITFMKKVFDAEEHFRQDRSQGVIQHAEITVGGATIMLADATAQFKKNTASMFIYVEDTDGTYGKAVDAGAKTIMEPFDESYKARSAGIEDPFGNQWWLATPQTDEKY